MDVATELSTRLAGYVGLVQDVLALLSDDERTALNLTSTLQRPDLLALRLPQDAGPLRVHLLAILGAYPGLLTGALEMAAPDQHLSLADKHHHDTPETRQLQQDHLLAFVAQVERLLTHVLLPRRDFLRDSLAKKAGMSGLSAMAASPPPDHWRYAIRALLYATPKIRVAVLDALAPYEPILVAKARQVLEQRKAVGPEGRRRLLTDDRYRDKVLGAGKSSLPFEVVFRCELKEVEARRNARPENRHYQTPTLPESFDAWQRADGLGLCGLAFSGGGIRSATFNLGILQGLAGKGWLPRVDYLSTVSGGSYLGAWFSAWVKRAGSLDKVVDRLCPDLTPEPRAEEVRPIRWLRMYSNYLAPNPSIMSQDSWTMGLTWLRNALLNQLIIVLALGAVVALSIALQHLWRGPTGWTQQPSGWAALLTVLTLGAGLAGGFGMSMYKTGHRWPPRLRVRRLVTLTLLLSMVGAFLASALMVHWLPPTLALPALRWTAYWPVGAWLVATLFGVLLFIAVIGRYDRCFYNVEDQLPRKRWKKRLAWVWISFWSLLAAVVGLVALLAVWHGLFTLFHYSLSPNPNQQPGIGAFDYFARATDTLFYQVLRQRVAPFTPLYMDLAFLLGLPLVLEALAVTVIARMALLGRNFPDERREWWGRLGAVINLTAVLWLVVVGSTFVGPYLFEVIQNSLAAKVAATGWAALVAAAVRWAYSARTPAQPDQPGASSWVDTLLSVGPYAFGLGLLLLIAALVKTLLVQVEWVIVDEALRAFALAGVLGAVALLLAWRIDVNEFSLHHFYRNRLTRAYLGASRRRSERAHTANPFTSFDRLDDLKLCRLRRHDPLQFDKPYDAPYLIINAALNATVVTDLARQDRKAESFVFTPHYCGFDFTSLRAVNPTVPSADFGYRPTRQYAYPEGNGPALGTALTISGAAANPNCGYSSSPASAFLLTLFNIRLGWWMGNPWREDTWRHSGPRLGLLYLLKDLVGRSGTDDRYVNLSDGGHFDNMGVYELVRRRCRFVIVGDGEEDHLFSCEGLANAIRRCRVDFGVEIDLDVTPITNRTNRISKRHYTIGTISYPEDPPRQPSGRILYLKSSLTGNEPTDIREYAEKNTDFPHQSTADQFFNESQFESYRRLGLHLVEELNRSVPLALGPGCSLTTVFDQLQQTVAPPPSQKPVIKHRIHTHANHHYHYAHYRYLRNQTGRHTG
ncbi:patatin-like phospholipase family protein [Hymenobacter defluvii]|uniref:Patatin-like phospholipase family protein n=1 Tax=Hymenobacter defluvii TaxID=2054411 RepID=A0ABS3TC54_9BACT|nr:patatin-like phospholipase family protein [Hymenobacter defluvii]MBO3271233.1 patatin-like phospholipase family protein [Hymenobacter defluvii]